MKVPSKCRLPKLKRPREVAKIRVIKVKCGNCGEVTEKESYVMLGEVVPIPKSRVQANLVQKCKFCGREGTITMLPKSGCYLTVDYSFGGDKEEQQKLSYDKEQQKLSYDKEQQEKLKQNKLDKINVSRTEAEANKSIPGFHDTSKPPVYEESQQI
uniref:Uncharacterized protein n=1 Tax=Chenopodium quinoa TaxID=63459 RepID=A0A803M3K1_CHEQI